MALNPSTLRLLLEKAWLVPHGGSYPEDVQASGDRFASAVRCWFSLAEANGFLCTTAKARDRESQLASLATAAFNTGAAASVSQGLADALTRYITGQQFGLGVAAAPLGGDAAVTAFSDIFSDRDLSNCDRAQALAKACQELVLTTLVTFPPPLPTPARLM